MMRRALAILLAMVLGVAACAPGGDASRPGRWPAIEHTPTLVRGSCVVLRLLASDGVTDEVCATAEELAPTLIPLIERILSEREANPAPPARAAVALAIPAPAEHVEKARKAARRPRKKKARAPPLCTCEDVAEPVPFVPLKVADDDAGTQDASEDRAPD